ncbi:Ca2+-dependent phosphoinositide-specific phospholipase C [Streptomyces sp. H10-C2]|uniref:Ca2+-dependent phosphoinositide-specific phospholipase C n=1 Tax=unclassified Streptomyces TaxID=2593676 RepID=UPI0024B8C1A6|nr:MULTISPECIES: Ca2+-dependent phosphoinositide-specific phospholipase C [unclassified Streptomyces]MDJ0343766.1 Ca2+-dependent phosphoinositide-specific phospholipase C [Streptomyces sp. PH10-H1]MDJ0373287.1 Ca2+-dependent phosphoinositide-specific phospholipase C [Streptomyces sp. H10-C2]
MRCSAAAARCSHWRRARCGCPPGPSARTSDRSETGRANNCRRTAGPQDRRTAGPRDRRTAGTRNVRVPAVACRRLGAICRARSGHVILGWSEAQRTSDPNFWNLEYSHASLPAQFGTEHVRGIELDLFPDPAGGLYGKPLVRGDAGLGPLTDPAYAAPGFKVLHWADHDYGTSCVSLTICLRQVKQWSDAHPGHVALPILLELKRTDPAMEARGGPKSPPWTTAMLDALDAEIRAVLPDDATITPDDLRRPGRTLEASVLAYGWPGVGATRGQVMFLMDNQDQMIQDAYRAGGRDSLQGRVLFTNSRPGRADAAFVEWNDPTGTNTATIQDFVRRGYYVRTRADEPFAQAAAGDTARLRAALDSGAQMISTDFPVTGLAARYGSDYTAELPGGRIARCDPLTAPPGCRSGLLEH